MINSRTIINFSKTRQGRLAMCSVLFIIVLGIISIWTGDPPPVQRQVQGHAPPGESKFLVIEKEVGPYHRVNPAPQPVAASPPGTGSNSPQPLERLRSAPAKKPAPMQLYAAAPAAAGAATPGPEANVLDKLLSKAATTLPVVLAKQYPGLGSSSAGADPPSVYAPYGRLIVCQLVNTVDTASAMTPIIALVLKDLWHDGQLVIPAGAEVHGTAQRAPMRDRIIGGNSWVVVWRSTDADNGRELKLSAVALACSKVTAADSWALDDGSVGIPGRVIQTTNYPAVRKLAADLIAGGAEAATGKTTTLTASGSSSEFADDGKAVVANALNRAADEYARNIISTVVRDGQYVRCAAGTAFYLYVSQTIRKDTALVAATEPDAILTKH